MTLTTLHQRIVALREQLLYSNARHDLLDKLYEETDELRNATLLRSTESVCAEAGDVLVVLCAILSSHGLSLDDAAVAVLAKLEKRTEES